MGVAHVSIQSRVHSNRFNHVSVVGWRLRPESSRQLRFRHRSHGLGRARGVGSRRCLRFAVLGFGDLDQRFHRGWRDDCHPWIEGYDLAAQNFIPSGQPGGGHSYLAVNFYSDSECNTYTSSVYSSIFSAFDNWTLVNFTGWTPSGAVSAQVVVANQKTASGDFQTSCDAIYFARNPEMVFGDGFETTDTSGWSAVTGGVK